MTPERKARNAAKRKERYLRLKAENMCTMCGKVKAIEGQVLCEKCRESAKAARRKWEKNAPAEKLEKWNVRHNIYTRNRYYKRKAEGICVTCGKRPARKGMIDCFPCALKKSEMNRKRHEEAKNA